LGGTGASNGNFISPSYTVTHPTATSAAALADAALMGNDTWTNLEDDAAN
jgi:hypothetical protein